MNSYNELLDSLQLLYDNKDADRLFNTLNKIAILMNQVDGNLKGAKYRETFRYEQLLITIVFGSYHEKS